MPQVESIYYVVEYRNVEGDDRWTIVKAPEDMEESEIEYRMMNDSEVARVNEIYETNNTDYSRDFTDE